MMVKIRTLWLCCGGYCAGIVLFSVVIKPVSQAVTVGQLVAVVVFSACLTLTRGEK